MTINSKRDQIDGMKDDMNESKKQAETKATDEERADSQSVVKQRVTIAGGFLDFALFVADVGHLKFIIDTGPQDTKSYDFLLGLLITSLSLQVNHK
jgi:hypothetical protein